MESQLQAKHQVAALWHLLQCMGFIVNHKKLEPAKVLDFLGLTVDTLSMEPKFPLDKMKKNHSETWKLEGINTIPPRSLVRLLGKMNTTAQVPPAPLFFRNLQMSPTHALDQSSQCYETEVSLHQDTKQELGWWDSQAKWGNTTEIRDSSDYPLRCFQLGIECTRSGSDHIVVASYVRLYEGEVKHIDVPPSYPY